MPSLDEVKAELTSFVNEVAAKAEATAVQVLTEVSDWCDAKIAELGEE